MVIWVKNYQTALVAENYSKSQGKAIGKSITQARRPIKTHTGEVKWPLFVNKPLFWWSISITLNTNNQYSADF